MIGVDTTHMNAIQSATQGTRRLWKRYEVKYLVDPTTADRLKAYCRTNLMPDPYARKCPGWEYPVLSVYLDSDDRTLLRSTLAGEPDRFKLRVRGYTGMQDRLPEIPLFDEIKRKAYGIVFKTRTRRMAGQPILANAAVTGVAASMQISAAGGNGAKPQTPTAAVNGGLEMDRFSSVQQRVKARPMIGVFYLRQAFEDQAATGVRISFDRELHYGLFSTDELGGRIMWRPTRVNAVVLEIKFTNTFPFWVQDFIHRANLVRRGVCKYVICSMAAMGRPVDLQ